VQLWLHRPLVHLKIIHQNYIMTKILSNPLEETLSNFIQHVASFSTEDFNKVPFAESWTPGQVAEHIRISIDGMAKVLIGPVKETQRKPDEKVANLKEVFLNFSVKMKSPDFVVPETREYNKDEMQSSLEKVKSDLIKVSEQEDLTKTCLGFDFPNLGYLTRMEIISFVLFHTQRHTHQLQNIYTVLKEKQVS